MLIMAHSCLLLVHHRQLTNTSLLLHNRKAHYYTLVENPEMSRGELVRSQLERRLEAKGLSYDTTKRYL